MREREKNGDWNLIWRHIVNAVVAIECNWSHFKCVLYCINTGMNGTSKLLENYEKRELVREWREKLEIITTIAVVVVSHSSSHIKVVIFFLYPYWVLNRIFQVFIFFLYSFSSRVVSGFQLNIVSLFLFSHPTNIYPVKEWVYFFFSFYFLFQFSFLSRVVILIQFFAAFASWLALDSFFYIPICCFFYIYSFIIERVME